MKCASISIENDIYYTLYTVQCTLYNVQCTMYTVQCTLYNVQCTMYTLYLRSIASSYLLNKLAYRCIKTKLIFHLFQWK